MLEGDNKDSRMASMTLDLNTILAFLLLILRMPRNNAEEIGVR